MNQTKRSPQITSRADLERTTRFFCEMCILGGLYVVTFQSAVIKTEAFFLTHLHMNQTKRNPQEYSTFQMLLPPVGIRQSSDYFSCIWYQSSSPGPRSATDETCPKHVLHSGDLYVTCITSNHSFGGSIDQCTLDLAKA